MRFSRPVGWFCLLFLIAVGIQPARSEERTASDSLVSKLPQGALATLEFAKLEPLIERIETSPALKELLESPQGQDALKQEPVKRALAGKALAEGLIGMNSWTFAKTLLGDRAILGVYPPSQPGGSPDGVVIIRVKDAESLGKLSERLVALIPLAGDKVKVGEYEGGGRLISLNDDVQLVIRDRWIVVGKVKSLVDQSLKNLANEAQPSGGLGDVPAWKQMTATLGTDHEIQFCLNMPELCSLVGQQRIIPSKLDNGVTSLLLGGYLELAANSPYIGSTIDIRENQVEWKTVAAGNSLGLDKAHQPFVLNETTSPVASVPALGGLLNGFSLTRDFAGWYRNREALLDAKLLPGFDKFETGLAPFLPNRDFGEDVLPLLGKKLTIITSPQSFAHLKGKPGVQLPGIAILLDLEKPAEANDLLNLVFQTVIGISNLQASQEGRQPFVLSSEAYRGTQIAYAKYLKQPDGDVLPISSNFQPASARVGSRFLITTNVGMCRQLIDHLQAETPAAVTTTVPTATRAADGSRDVYFELSPVVAADLLESNSSVLKAQGLQQGKSSEQATRELDTVLKLLRQLTPLTFSSTRFADRWELEFRAGWK